VGLAAHEGLVALEHQSTVLVETRRPLAISLFGFVVCGSMWATDDDDDTA